MSIEQKTQSVPLFMRPGHCAGDLLGASEWIVRHETRGHIELEVEIPGRVMNPRQQLFGGFTGTYVDMVALYAIRTLFSANEDYWITTVNMRIDYLEPVVGPRIRLRGELIKQGRSTSLVAVHFMDLEGNRQVYALATMRVLDRS